MNFKTGDVVRVLNTTAFHEFRGRQGVVYPNLSFSWIPTSNALVLFVPDHEDRVKRLSALWEGGQIDEHMKGYERGLQAYIELKCLELVKHGVPRKRRGKRHRMRIGGIDGEAVLWR